MKALIMFCTIAVMTGAAALCAPAADSSAEHSAVCGNGLIEDGETCTCNTCPADCAARPCPTTSATKPVSVALSVPEGLGVAGVTVLLGYKSDRVSLPGSGAASTVAGRVTDQPPNAIMAFNDLDYGLRVVVSRSAEIPPGRIFTVTFDVCEGVAAPNAADFGCTVEGCVSVFGAVNGCSCTVVLP